MSAPQHRRDDPDANQPAALPPYVRIRRDVRRGIDEGAYPLGSAIPSESELSQGYGVSRLTVRRALDGLAEDGSVLRVQGRGTFVTRAAPSCEEGPLGFRESMRLEHREASVRILHRVVREAGPYYASLFGIEQDDALYNVRRLNSVGGVPASIEDVWIPCPLLPGIEDVDVSLFSLYEAYALRGHRVTKALEYLEVVSLTARDAQILRLDAGEPALLLDCLSYDAEGRVLEHATSVSDGATGVYSSYV
ncbi:GntR family transcriptional regulator [Thermophilibacter immobilis]|jgi:GntR family transcriptional regulator|uniref:GntR family transcriptional regulator n=1 Tax=Thermophilibacter immobilis TaxID=2779519 RepID=A0A7S7M780_9ACTN|nr:GntR family transcriptional regulator [Thermophilibacter immobilis]QOY60024.1 GntR family transcriptional regulator [Thermophilibacter immobilis]